LGRFPIRNRIEARTIISKIIQYESANETIDYSYFDNLLISEAYLNIDEVNREFENGHMSVLYSNTKTINKNVWYQFDFFNWPSNSVLYNGHYYTLKDQPNETITTGEELNRENFISALRNGTAACGPFHFIWHGDHSERTIMGASQNLKNQNVTNENIDTLGFQGGYYQVILSGGCHPADFRTTCIAKSFLSRHDKGAVAFIGNVDVGYQIEIPDQFVSAIQLYKKQILSNHKAGFLWLNMLDKSMIDKKRLHLLGDPTMVIWTDEPQSISPTTSLSGNFIQISRPSSFSGQTWHVCAYKKGELYATDSLTTGNNLSFPISDIRTSGYVYLTYTGLNLRPYCDSIYINKGESSQLEISVQSIGNNPYNASDIALSPGDSVPITVNIHNNGNTMVNRMTVQFASDNPNINIGEGQKYHFYLDAGESFQETFGFRVKTDCPTSTIHDNNGIRLYFSITDDNNNHYYDECYINVYKPKPIITYLYYGGVQGLSNTYEMKVKIANSGFLPLNGQQCILTSTHPSVTITQGTANIGLLASGEQSNLLTFRFTSSLFYAIDLITNYQLNLNVKGTQGWTITLPVEGSLRPASLSASSINIKPGANYVDISVSKDTTIKYDIYKKIGNDYVCISDYPVFQYFRDDNLTPQTSYTYKLKSVTVQGVESDNLSEAVSATTLCAKADGFPKRLIGSKRYTGGLVAGDVDQDGRMEIFAKYKNWLENKSSVVAIKADGSDLFTDLDHYISEDIDTKPSNSQGGVVLGELFDDGVQYIVSSTYSDDNTATNFVSCYSLANTTNATVPTLYWEKSGINYKCPRSPIIADMDCDDINEVVVPTINHVYVFSASGTLIADINKNINYCAPAIASVIPNSTNKQLIFPVKGTMYAYNKSGTMLSKVYESAGIVGTDTVYLTSPLVCDFDNDGVNEVIFGEWKGKKSTKTANVEYKCAKYISGTYFSITTLFSNTCRINGRKDCNLSCGDVNCDGLPDLVSYGSSYLKIYDNATNSSKTVSINTSDNHGHFALIADINGDNNVEIVYPDWQDSHSERIRAVNCNGIIISDFQILEDERAGEDMMIADIDGDGFSELVIGELCGQMSVWKTKGNPDKIEWGMVRGDAQNTGEYHKTVYPQLMQSGTVTTTNWTQDLYVTGNGVNASGTMNIADHKKVIVWENGVMNLSGATMNNAKVIVKDGGTMNLSNSSTVNLRNTKSFQVDKGGTLFITSGTIK